MDALVADVPALLDDCEEGARRAVAIVAELRNFSRTNEHDGWRLADIHRGLESTLTMLAWRCAQRVFVHRDFGAIPPVECLPGQLNQVFMNLVSNALDAIGSHRGNVWVTTGSHPAPQGADGVRISVRDDGCGMSDEVRLRACEPFFTTKPVGQGTGLGLSVSFAIVARHGGTLHLESAPGAGSTVAVVLPTRRPASEGARKA
jgi:signal transduction histidine kinase